MKKLSKINLHNLSKTELSRHEENLLRGGAYPVCGCVCGNGCSCLYAGEKENEYDSYYGGASIDDNGYANQNNVQLKASDEGKNSDPVN